MHTMRVKIIICLLATLNLLGPSKVQGEEKKWSLALAIASASFSSPESIFGHAFLVLYDGDEPGLSSIAISVIADTRGDHHGMGYLLKGLGGGYQSIVYVEPFSSKIFSYGLKEKRDIYLVKLRVSEDQLAEFATTLDQGHFQLGPYYFFNENCASGIHHLLFELEVPLKKRNHFFTMPNGLVGHLDDQNIENIEVLRTPHSQKLDFEEQVVLSFYSEGESSDDFLKTNLQRKNSLRLKKEQVQSELFLDHKFGALFFDRKNIFRLSLIERGAAEATASNKALNEVTILSPQFIDQLGSFKFDSLTLFKLIKQEKASPLNKTPFNGGVEVKIKEFSEINIRLGSAVEVPSLANSIFFDISTDLTVPNFQKSYLSLRYYQHLLNEFLAEIHLHRNLGDIDKKDHAKVGLTWTANKRTITQLFWSDLEQISLGVSWRF